MYPSILLDFANRKALDSRLSFSRASTGRYYDGVTAVKAEENLFLQSQTFENASWIVTNSTITANTSAAPDGTTTAETITASSGTGQHLVRQDTSAIGTLTASVFAKAGTHNFLQIFHGNSANYFADFDLSGGTVGTTGASTTASIVSIGSGWYRCIITFTTAANSAIRFAIVSSSSAVYNESWTAVGTETVLLWGAQLEQRASVTAYTATTTQTITRYQPALQTAAANVPRFDHDPVTGQSLGLLIENQKTNLLTYSEQFDNAAWTKGAVTITANTIVAPDGTLTGDKIVTNAGVTAYGVRPATVPTTAQAYTQTVYAKAAGFNYLKLTWAASQNGTDYAVFNLNTGAVTGGVYTFASITSVGNGWYRCAITSTLAATTDNGYIWVSDGTLSRGAGVTGDGYSGIYIWGAQLEVGLYPTSYIATVGSQITRSRDLCSGYWFNFLNLSEGSYFVEYDAPAALAGDYKVMSAYGDIYARKGADYNQLYMDSSLYASAGYYSASRNRLAMSYTNTTAAAAANQMPAVSDTGNISMRGDYHMPLTFSASTAADSGVSTHIAKFAYYPKALTNYQLQALTI